MEGPLLEDHETVTEPQYLEGKDWLAGVLGSPIFQPALIQA